MNKKIFVTRVSSNNQVTIPNAVLKALHVNPSDEIEWTVELNDLITVRKASPQKNDFWKAVDAQERKYGSVNTSEINWGKDVGSEKLE